MEDSYDVVVVGAGAAGLSGALALGRARRSVLVVDAGEPRNAPAGHVHDYLGREGTPPGELLAQGREEVARYGVEVEAGRVTVAVPERHGFAVRLEDGRAVQARRLLVATGLVDVLPDVPGVHEQWGGTVLHCPYCHGWEVRDGAVGVLGSGPLGVHSSLLWRQWTADVTYFVHTAPAPTDEEREQLAARGIRVVEDRVAAWEDGGVRLVSGELVARTALVVAPVLTARSAVLEHLGVAAEDVVMGGHVVGSQVPADPTGLTAVPGVWVAGNVADVLAQVVGAAAAGLQAAAALNADLVSEDTAEALFRARFSGQEAWDERYLSRPALWSGRPNAVLVTEAADLPPGRALDAGCGEGADALWLAERGWQVTGTDLSAVALERAAQEAAARGLDATWLHDELPAGEQDLVTAHFLHLPTDERRPLYARLAGLVAPGGTLLLVGHDPHDALAAVRSAGMRDWMFTAEELAADLDLDPEDWDVEVCQARPRQGRDHEGRDVEVADAVLRARRRG